MLLQAERDAADAAEAEQWIGQISVEGGGTGEDAAQEAQVCSCHNSTQPKLAACSRTWQCLLPCYTLSGPEDSVMSNFVWLLLQALLAEFEAYIKQHKTVALDELAAEFGLRTQDAITRVQELEASGRLTGVMDDRGKVCN